MLIVRGSQTVRAWPVASAASAASSASSIAWRVGATPQSTRRSPPASRPSGTGSVPPGGSVPRWLSGSPSTSTSTAKVRCVWLTSASMLRSVSRVPVSSASEPCSDTSHTRQRGSRPQSRPPVAARSCAASSRGAARVSACTASPGVFTTTPATGRQPELICTTISRGRSSCQSRWALCSSASPSQKRSSVDSPGCSTKAPGGGSPSPPPPPPPPVLDVLDAKLVEVRPADASLSLEASASPEAEVVSEVEVAPEVDELKLNEASRRGTGGSTSSAAQ